MGWSRHVRHRLRRHEHQLRLVGDVVLLVAALVTLCLIAVALLALVEWAGTQAGTRRATAGRAVV